MIIGMLFQVHLRECRVRKVFFSVLQMLMTQFSPNSFTMEVWGSEEKAEVFK